MELISLASESLITVVNIIIVRKYECALRGDVAASRKQDKTKFRMRKFHEWTVYIFVDFRQFFD